MSDRLTRDEDTALRCLAALAEAERLSAADTQLLTDLRARDERAGIRREGTIVPRQRAASNDVATPSPSS
jgi:hypothetical protein